VHTSALIDFRGSFRPLGRLFRASKFARHCTRIVYEPQRINLFAECVR
jgi:hypothetical protein